MNQKTAIITGFTGQDGSWLAKFLLAKGYRVIGTIRRASHPNLDFINEMGIRSVIVEEVDITDSSSLYNLILKYKPDEFYHLAAQSHVGTSFNQPLATAEITGLGTLRVLDAIRMHSPHTRFYQAGSSEEFGDVIGRDPQDENTTLRARSPYAAAKIFAHHITKVYRESYGLFACVGILFNHESERRSKTFVTRKVTNHVAQIFCGITDEPLRLGNLYSYRDFGYAPDYCEAMWMMLQQEEPDDFVISTGEPRLVKDFVTTAFAVANMPIYWEGEGLNEVAKFKVDGSLAVVIDEEFYRPAEVDYLCGNSSKAHKTLNWSPRTPFEQWVKKMVNYDMETNHNDITKHQTYNPQTLRTA